MTLILFITTGFLTVLSFAGYMAYKENWTSSEKSIETDWECEPRDIAGRFTSTDPQTELRKEYLNQNKK